MQKFLNDQHHRLPHTAQIARSDPNHNVFGACMLDTDMVSPDSHHSRGNAYDLDNLDIDDLRQPQLATTGAITGGSCTSQRISMPVVAELKVFSGRDHDDEGSRGGVRKVRSSFLRDEAPFSEKCLVFTDLLTGTARKWYFQLSRLTRNKWND